MNKMSYFSAAGASVVVVSPPRSPPTISRTGVALVVVMPSRPLIWFWICPMMISCRSPLACSALLGTGVEETRLHRRMVIKDSFIILIV